MSDACSSADKQHFTGLEDQISQMPVASWVFGLNASGALVFISANTVADRLMEIDHSQMKGLGAEEILPHLKDPEIMRRYCRVANAGPPINDQGTVYGKNGMFLGMFSYRVFCLHRRKVAVMAIKQENCDGPGPGGRSATGCGNLDIKVPERFQGESPLNLSRNLFTSLYPDDACRKEDAHELRFTDLFTSGELEKIQTAFTKITNMASIITTPSGQPITEANNFCTLCRDVIRKTPAGLANCIHSDSVVGRLNPDGPTLRPCLSGGVLWDCGVNIIVGGHHVANWLMGQVRLDDRIDTAKLTRYARQIGADETVFVDAYKQVPVTSYLNFYRTCHFLFLFANLLSEMAYQNLLLTRSNASHLKIAKALKYSESRLRHLSSKLILAQEEERRQLAVELHDGIGQSLTAAKYSVDNILMNLDNPDVDIKALVRSGARILKGGISDIRQMQVALRPRILDELGAIAAIKWFCREFSRIYTEIRLDLHIDLTEAQISDPLKPTVFRIIQEALNNAAKYSEGSRISLSFAGKSDALILEIKDNGIGFDLEAVLSSGEMNRGLGLDSMRERAELCGGRFKILTAPGKGTAVHALWPVHGW